MSNTLNPRTAQLRQALGVARLRAETYWLARTEQERKFLRYGAAALVLMLFYTTLVGPALSGREQLQKNLPQLRQQGAKMQVLAHEAAKIAGQPAAQVPLMTSSNLTAALTTRGLKAQSLNVTGEYAKLQFTGAQFAGLMQWLAAIRRESRITVQEASIVAQSGPGLVDATITLHQGGAAK